MACTGVGSAVIGHHPLVSIRIAHQRREHNIVACRCVSHLYLKDVLSVLTSWRRIVTTIDLGVAGAVAEVV